MPYYPVLLRKYSELLDARVSNGEISPDTAETYMRDANRLFETLIWAFSEDALVKIGICEGLAEATGRWPET